MNRANRGLILIGTMLAQLGLGTLYTWSLFNEPLATLHGWTLEQVVLSFSITSFSLAIGTLFAGKLQEIFGVRIVVAACGIILGLGLFIAPRVTALWELYITAGVIVGLVNGIAYIMTLSNCIKWFPETKGIISGLSIGCYGLGSLIFKYVNSDLIKSQGIISAFMYWGLIAFVFIFIGALLLKDAPIVPVVEHSAVGREYRWTELFSRPEAYLLFIAFFGSCLSGLYLIGTAKNIGVIFAGLTPAVAGNAVAIVAVFNTIGRVILGAASDRIKRTYVSAFAFLLIIIGVVIILFVPLDLTMFTIAISCIAFAFGGNLTVFPAIVSEYFGLKNHTKNYSVIYQGFGIGGLLGGLVADAMGGLKPTFWFMLVVAIIAFLIMLFVRVPKDREGSIF
ncbi:MAG: L-lactate MFS transporter [Sarcina sp.]